MKNSLENKCENQLCLGSGDKKVRRASFHCASPVFQVKGIVNTTPLMVPQPVIAGGGQRHNSFHEYGMEGGVTGTPGKKSMETLCGYDSDFKLKYKTEVIN